MARILVAEDSPTQAERLVGALEAEGFSVTHAPDGERALALFRDEAFDLVISDVVMPGLSGYELCRGVKAARSHRAVPVVLVTSLNDAMDVIRGLECGADSFLRKPYDPADLIERVRRMLSSVEMRGGSRLSLGIEVAFLGRKFTINSDKEQILDLLISTFEDTIRANRELQQSRGSLAAANAKIQTYARELEERVRDRTAALAASERRFQDIAEVSGDWIWDTDGEHRLTGLAGDGASSLPVAATAMIGRTWWEIAGAPASDPAWIKHKAALDAHQPFRNFRHAIRTPAGGERHIVASGKPVFDAAGNFLGHRGTATDETAIVEAVRRAEAAEGLLRDAIESISGGIMLCDKDDRIVLSNRYVQDHFPGSDDILGGKTSYDAFVREMVARGHYPDAAGCEEAWIAERMATHRAASSASEYRRKDGRWLLVNERRTEGGGIAIIGIDVTPLKTAQAALAASEERLDRAQAIAGIGSWELDLASGHMVWSKEMYRLRGLSDASLPPNAADLPNFVAPEDLSRMRDWTAQLAAGEKPPMIEFGLARPDGEMRRVIFEGTEIRDEAGRIARVAGTLRDVTAQRLTERQLAQAQKMEAIGNLTGGLAHDFNNLLGVVIGNLDLLREFVGERSELEELAKDALDAALRGADLTRRLLAFARRQPLSPERVSPNDLISNITKLLSRTLGTQIDIRLDLATDLWLTCIDPAQLEAAITNLATNARDAMAKGGRLTIATRNIHLDADYVSEHIEAAAGDYVIIEVTDTGTGIAPEVVGRIFEPFFTTKEQGKGTGLGLSMVFGFIRQSGGHLNVYSEIGEGTTFRLYLPRDHSDAIELAPRAIVTSPHGAGETILLVEDNTKLSNIVVKQLTTLGYRILTADNASAARTVIEKGVPVDLLLTDVVMPGGMSGIDLAREASAQRPRLKILLTSGFPDLRFSDDPKHSLAWRLLSKPYRKEDLARAVRETLDGVIASTEAVIRSA